MKLKVSKRIESGTGEAELLATSDLGSRQIPVSVGNNLLPPSK